MSVRTAARIVSEMRGQLHFAETSAAALRRSTRATAAFAERTFASSSRSHMPRQHDHYGSLKLHKNATKQQIKAKFYELSKKTHPDTPGGSAEKFHEINEAYSILGDEAKRRDYDQSLSAPSQTTDGSYSFRTHSHQSPYSDPYQRRSGPHGAWSTRRPPPRAPPTGFGTYSPYGRHTPPGYSGASSGSYGDPWASAREQFREEFANVRSGNMFTSHSHSAGSHTGAPNATYGGRRRGPHTRRPGDMEGRDSSKTFGIIALVVFVVLLGGGITTAKADEESEMAGRSGDERDGALRKVM